MSIKVGVRVRPFNKRQQNLEAKCCVEMQDNTTILKTPSTSETKKFNYDYSFWSHDKFVVDETGVYVPVDSKYADQKKVYDLIGTDILSNAWEGYNCCLFAYGQTGSGKSYSMLGYGANRGIIPMICDNIFDRITNDKDKNHSYEVKVSMMEIYNETLRDLLTKAKKPQQLKICQSKTLGVYVEGLVKHPVHSYTEIANKIEEGSNNRSIAATLMNESSSRSHTIVSITFVQKIQISIAQTSIKYSTIHLVDLAGSQSVGKTGVDSKDRLREAAKINQSLSTLGRVIQILAENTSKTDKTFVPYRDSKLTFILRNALGGNSRTVMICAISPADDNYEETLSTLRYANRAKKIQNKATINESDVDKLIRMLRQENEMLKKMLREAQSNKTIINTEMISNVEEMSKNMADFGLIAETEKVGEGADTSTAEDTGKQDLSFAESNLSMFDYDDKVDEKQPYITNLSDDQLLSGRLKYSCSKVLRIGNKQGIPKPDVCLAALGIQPLHCQIRNESQKLYIQILDDQASDYTFLNGYPVPKSQSLELYNYDRLIFGTGSIFIVKIPQGKIRKIFKNGIQKEIVKEDIDYIFAVTEIQENHISGGMPGLASSTVGGGKGTNAKIEQEEIRKKVLEEIQVQYEKMRQLKEEEMKSRLIEQEKVYQQKIKQIEKVKAEQEQRLKLQLEKQANEAQKLQIDKQKVQEQIQLFKELEQKLEQSSTTDKQALQEARKALEEKIQTISTLQTSLLQIEQTQQKMKEELQQTQLHLQKQLELKLTLCNNENILNQYKFELSKKLKNSQEIKEQFLRKERNELQRQLVELVPMVEKWNLIAKEMDKSVEAGLSIEYVYLSEAEVLEIVKSGGIGNGVSIGSMYKNKLKITVHVYNREEKRNYFWSIGVFKNRYEIALSLFELYIRNQKDPKLSNKENDPYWDPPTPQLIGTAFLSLEPLFYKLQFSGQISIVQKGQKIGKMSVSVYPTDTKYQKNLSLQTLSNIAIYSPRDFIQKTLYFTLEISSIKLEREYMYNRLQLEYNLMIGGGGYKTMAFSSQFLPIDCFSYKGVHALADLSENIIVGYVEQPLGIRVYAEMKQIEEEDTLTSRDQSFVDSPDRLRDSAESRSSKSSFYSENGPVQVLPPSLTSSFTSKQGSSSGHPYNPDHSLPASSSSPHSTPPSQSSPLKKSFTSNPHSGIIVSNFDVMSKIEMEFNKQKQQMKKRNTQVDRSDVSKGDKKTKGKGGKDDCKLF